MSTRAKIPVSDLITLQRGFDLPTARRKEGNVPVIASTGIAGYHNEAKVQGPGVVIGRSGSIGGGQYTTDDFWPLNTTLWVKDFKGNNPRYTYYLLKGIDFTRFNAGAGVPTLNRNHIAGLRVSSFRPAEQDRIASILSAYDDLIENNRRRIQLLEESARLLYREWFVCLRFPGHEHVKIIDGVPEEWEMISISKLAESINYGYTASGTQEKIGPKFLRITDIVPENLDWSRVPYCEIPDNKKDKFLLSEGDVVIARTGATTGYAKRIGKIHPEAIFASYLVRIRFSNQIDDIMAGVFLESDEYKAFIRNNIGGAAQPNANAKIISSATLCVPPQGIQKQFRETVEPFFLQKDILQSQNQKLKTTRDLLLPRLMNGEIAI